MERSYRQLHMLTRRRRSSARSEARLSTRVEIIDDPAEQPAPPVSPSGAIERDAELSIAAGIDVSQRVHQRSRIGLIARGSEDLLNSPAHAAPRIAKQGFEESVAGPEVMMDGGIREPDPGRHRTHLHCGGATLAQELGRGIEDQSSRFFGSPSDSGHATAFYLDLPWYFYTLVSQGGGLKALTKAGSTRVLGSVAVRAERFLRARGAETIVHPGGSLLAHLRRTYVLLLGWNAPDALALAGLCHAAYGTDGFPQPLIDRARRSVVVGLIGPEAEALVYRYCACDRDATYAGLGEEPLPLHDRFGGGVIPLDAREAEDFAVLTIANELDLVRAGAFAATGTAEIVRLFRRLRSVAPGAARQALAEMEFGDAEPCPAAGCMRRSR